MAGRKTAEIVNDPPDTVSKPVPKIIAVARVGDRIARNLVDRVALHAGRHGGDRGVVGFFYNGEHFLKFGAKRPALLRFLQPPVR